MSSTIVEYSIQAEQELLNKALDKDPRAVKQLIEYLEPALLIKANALVQFGGSGGRFEIKDLVQVAWRELISNHWKMLRQWDPHRNVSLKAFVGVVSARRMISELRKQKKNWNELSTSPEDLSHIAEAVDFLEEKISNQQLVELVVKELRSRLTKQGEQAFNVLYLEELSVEEASERTSLSKASLYGYRNRIKHLAQAIIEQFGQRKESRGSPVNSEKERLTG